MGFLDQLFGKRKDSGKGASENGSRRPVDARGAVDEQDADAEGGGTKSLASKMAAVRKPAWIPETAVGDPSPSGSKFSGTAFIAAGEQWPACGNCGKPMQLFVQLAANELPKDVPFALGNDLLQFFYCTNGEVMCDVDTEGFFPFKSNASLVRVVSADGEPAVTETPVDDSFPPRSITGWQRVGDYASPEEHEALGVQLSGAEEDAAYEAFPARQGDKLAGWPAWVQGPEYPSCPKCNATMRVIMQLESEDNVPHMWGDLGNGHITQCPEHLDVLAFGWACS